VFEPFTKWTEPRRPGALDILLNAVLDSRVVAPLWFRGGRRFWVGRRPAAGRVRVLTLGSLGLSLGVVVGVAGCGARGQVGDEELLVDGNGGGGAVGGGDGDLLAGQGHGGALGHVTDGVDARDAGVAEVVDLDAAALEEPAAEIDGEGRRLAYRWGASRARPGRGSSHS